jgi:hypothetical protein
MSSLFLSFGPFSGWLLLVLPAIPLLSGWQAGTAAAPLVASSALLLLSLG